MKLKYIATLLTSSGLVAAAAVASARQDVRPPEEKAAQVRKVGSPEKDAYADRPGMKVGSADNNRSSEVPNTIKGANPFGQAPDQSADSNLVDEMPGTYQNRIALNAGSEQHELSVAESALARKADGFKRMLEQAKGDTQRNEVRAKLSENLGKQFDFRQKRHRLEIEALERQVAKLKELVRKRQDSREEIISRRVEEIQREVDGLGW
jgi:hypothetical protein